MSPIRSLCPIILLLSTPLSAMDLGRQGMVFDIQEEDMRAVMARELQGLDKQAIETEIKESVKTYAERKFKPADLLTTDTTSIRYHDPSMVLTQDIVGMNRNEQGDYEWQVLWPKGTVVNQLRSTKLTSWLFYFDARSEKQMALAKALLQRYPLQIRLILTAGNPIELSKSINTPTYFATANEIDRFNLQRTPTLVRNGKFDHEYELELIELNAAQIDIFQFATSILDQDRLPAISVNAPPRSNP